ncbi:MAG: DCC1-like thiol-disulfide oxidoreductase family protein [Methylococcaceae bacterium]|nr:DCC1-like thiol-disulfide oxidoreductase family protein [Methylococcaceae bacterium]
MYKILYSKISHLYYSKAPATGVGLFRLLFGLITLQEIFFLLYFNHLIFDPIPYLDVEFPMIPFFLCLWAVVATFLTIGYRSQQSIIANYIFWIVFVNFTPMQRDFDGGFDLFMIGANFFMIFMPIDKAFSIDNLKNKLQTPFKHYSLYPKQEISILAYYLPVFICLGFLYFDSAIHKMFAEHWRNGLGAWLPASMPYYISPIKMTWLLNNEILQKTVGYIIIFFQFTFIFFFHIRQLRPLFFLIGAGLHLGITITLNIYPFGMGMLIFYTLIMPFSWYRKIGLFLCAKEPSLIVFYDDKCPLCCRTILTINHFDIFNCIDFKSVQSQALEYPALNNINQSTLLTDLYALDRRNTLYSGVDTYAHILIKMRYLALAGYILKFPGIYQLSSKIYRNIADTRNRITCDVSCVPESNATKQLSFYDQFFNSEVTVNPKRYIHRTSRILLVLFLFQINSSIHYGIFYRLGLNTNDSVLGSLISDLSNTFILFSNTFIGITPHALYLHDHFKGYNHLIAITYIDTQGNEKWLPFVSPEGRLLSPNWGRVHSMWANIAVTPNIDNQRLKKFIMKTTAFWGIKSDLNLNNTLFMIKLKKISAPSYWVYDLLNSNLSGNWISIGNASWHDKSIKIQLPDNINLL